LEFAQGAMQAVQMALMIEQASIPQRPHLINAIAELKAAIFA
jgi:hypothetical protein